MSKFNKLSLGFIIIFLILYSCNNQDGPLSDSNNISEPIIELNTNDVLEEQIDSSQLSKDLKKDTAVLTEKKIYGFMAIDEEAPVEKPIEFDYSNSSKNKTDEAFAFQSEETFGAGISGNGDGLGNGNKSGYGSGEDGSNGRDGIRGSYTKNKGRRLLNTGGITEQSQEEGQIALEIYVDEKGLVYRTKFVASKSNSATDYLVNLAVKWTHTMQYEKDLDGGNQYVGIKVFKFTKH